MNHQTLMYNLRCSRFTVRIFTLLVAGLIVSGAKSEDLPEDSKVLIERLEEFEAGELKKFEAVVADKRAQVTTILEQHLSRETKKGNLDGALALKAKVAELSETGSSLSEAAGAAMALPAEPNLEQAEAEFVGTAWKSDNPGFGAQELHFFANGKGEAIDKNGAKTPRTYELIRNGNGKETVVVMNEDQKHSLVVIRKKGVVVALNLGSLGSFVRLPK